MAQQLRNVNLDEVSLVDQPASPGAKVVLMKRGKSLSTSTKETPQERTYLSPKIPPKQPDSQRDAMDETQSSMRKLQARADKLLKQDGANPVAPASPSPTPVASGPTQQQVHVNVPLGSKKPKNAVWMQKAAAGVKFTIGFPKDGKGSKVQSVMFDSKQWTKEKAVAWLKDHDMKGGEPDVTENNLRYRQEDPAQFARFRVIAPGAKLAKALASVAKQLNTEDSWNVIQSLVGNALRDEVNKGDQSVPWVKDFHDDAVIYDMNGCTYRRAYTIEEDPSGENIVKFEQPEECDVFYISKQELETPEENESPALNKRLTSLNSRANEVLSRFQ